MITLYYSPGACSLAPHIALEEVGADYKAISRAIAQNQHKNPEYLAISPRGRVPVLDADGQIISESQAILTFVAQAYPQARLVPFSDPVQMARCYEWLGYFISELHIVFAQLWRPERFTEDASLYDTISAQGRQSLDRHFQETERRLSGITHYVMGHSFTICDPHLLVFYRWGNRIGVDMTKYPRWSDHARLVASRPAVQTVMKREGITMGSPTQP